MAWLGEITDFQVKDSFLVSVEYYDDLKPNRRVKKFLDLPLSTTKDQINQAVKDLGADVANVSSLSRRDLIGKKILLD